jgi:hypothetical protein
MATIRSFDELNLIARPRYLLRPMIELGSIGMLYGPSGLGKSFLAIDLALCVASGRPWGGMRTTPSRVLYIGAEGGNAVGRRVRAWYLHTMALCESDEERQYVIAMLKENFREVPHAVQVAQSAAAGDLVESAHTAFGHERIGLVIFDTVARNAVDLEENSNTDMGRFIEAVVAVKTGLCVPQEDTDDGGEPAVLLIHHTGKQVLGVDGRPVERGASALRAGMDFALALDAGPPLRLLTEKLKDGAEPAPMAVTWTGQVQVGYDFDEQAPITSVVPIVDRPGSALSPAEHKVYKRKIEEGKLDRAIMDEMIRDPQITTRDIALNLDISKSGVARRVKYLQECGRVTRRDKCYYADAEDFAPLPQRAFSLLGAKC